MNEEVKSTFAQEAPEPSEKDLILKRIQQYKVGLTPQQAQATITILQSGLKNGMFGISDIDVVSSISKDISTGIEQYNLSFETAQRRLNEIAEEELVTKQEEIAKREAAQQQKLADERSLRKQTQDKLEQAQVSLAQMEAVLKSHGIHLDLDGDGIVGLKQGQTQRQLTAEEQLQVDNIVSIEKNNIADAPIESTPKAKSKAWEMVRALNPQTEVEVPAPTPAPTVDDIKEKVFSPETELSRREKVLLDPLSASQPLTDDEEVNAKIEEAKTAFKEWEESNQEIEIDPVDEIPENPKTFQDFIEEVEKVEDERSIDEQLDDAEGEYGYEDLGEDLPVEDLRVAEEDTKTQPNFSQPKVSGGNAPNLKAVVNEPVNVTAPIEKPIPSYDSEEELLAAAQARIDAQQEEEFEEISIPDRIELEGMSKKQIKDEADKLGFEVSAGDSKSKMITSFEEQTQQFIQELQDAGEFVSATDTSEEDESNRSSSFDYPSND